MQHPNDSRSSFSASIIHEYFRRKVWDSRIPVQIVISEDELLKTLPKSVWHSAKGKPFFRLASRTSYLPLLLSQLRRHYDSIFTAMETTLGTITPWLEYKGRVISWHYPVGHLFDEFRLWESSCPLPWTLTLHFSDYPQTLPLHGWLAEEGGGALGVHFYSMLKQADYIRNGSIKGINNLSKIEQTQLWDGVWTHSYEKFWKVQSRLLGSEDPQSAWRGLPLRLYTHDKENCSRSIIQRPISMQECATMHDIRRLLLPEFEKDVKLVCHGVEIPDDTPLSWLASYFIYPDGFLHIIVS